MRSVLFELDAVLLSPFSDYLFMRRALIGSLTVCLGAVPVGVFMTLRRMSLTGDAMAHAILPGVAIAYIFSGLSLIGMTLGGLVAGLIVALLAGWVSRETTQKEDSSFAAFYLMSLALGVIIISHRQSSVDLFHVLFGNILALDSEALWLLAIICSLSLCVLALLFRPLVIDCVDPTFLRRTGRKHALAHYGFLFLMVINLVAGFHALGTLMAIGIMILPTAASRFWVNTLDGTIILSVGLALLGCYVGLTLSFHFDVTAGPAIVLCLGFLYLVSLVFGVKDGVFNRVLYRYHKGGW